MRGEAESAGKRKPVQCPNYEYMIVDGTQYDPIQTEGNSTFEIPVTLDTELAVSASTVAMSQPHLVDYTLYFDSASLAAK